MKLRNSRSALHSLAVFMVLAAIGHIVESAPPPKVGNQCQQTPPPLSYGHPRDCTNYFQCAHGAAVPKTCPAGTVFNEQLHVCVHQGSVHDICTVKDSGPPKLVNKCQQTPAPTFYSDPNDCAKFFQCAHSVAVPKTCAPGTVFSETANVCVTPGSAHDTCTGKQSGPPKVENQCQQTPAPMFYSDPNDCAKFFQCAHGVAVPKTCAPGTVFSETANVCVIPGSGHDNCKPSCPGDGWSLLGKSSTNCVKVFRDRKRRWHDARNQCKSKRGDLVTIRSSEEQHDVNEMAGNIRFWIGLHDSDKDGKFHWLDETTETQFTAWWRNQPTNRRGNERCAIMIKWRGGKWTDKRCNAKNYYICQKKARATRPGKDVGKKDLP